MGKKSSTNAAPRVSSSSALAANAASTTSHRSSILKSAFAPSYLQLHLFASVIHSFESQQLRIHDTSSGRLRQSHTVPARVDVTCLDWGCYGPSYRSQRNSSRKKRKRSDNIVENVVVAYGTSNGEICMFAPSEGKTIGSLKGGHEREVKDFRFLPEDNLEAWSIGGDGKLVQWNLQDDLAIRSISLPDPSIQKLCNPSRSPPQILCASSHPFAIDIESKDDFRIESFNAFKNPVHTLIRSGTSPKSSEETFFAADRNRHMNVYDISSKEIVRTLVAGAEVERAEIHQPVSSEDQILAVVTKDGMIELFSKPFLRSQTLNGDLKSKRKSSTRKADATIKLVSPDAPKKIIPVHTVFFDGPNLVIAYVEGGVEPLFQKLRWQDEGSGELLFEGVREVKGVRNSSTLTAATTNGAKNMGLIHVNDARTVVVNGLAEPGSQVAPVEIESSEDEDIEDPKELNLAEDVTTTDPSEAGSNAEMEDPNADLEGTTAGGEESGEPSFGDLLAARHPEAISMTDSLPVDHNALSKVSDLGGGILPSGMSLGTVLTQALRTNDQSLLETCLHVTDEHIIQNTILRLESSLAANLLTKLAERLADRPGRYGHLLTWVQATMIAHGGAIASQVGVASKLRTLYQVLNERSKILPSILLLKGKLDMMTAQQSFRTQAEAHRKGISAAAPATIYIEGQEDNWSSDEDEHPPFSMQDRGNKRSKKALQDLINANSASSEDEAMALVDRQDESETEDSEFDIEASPKRNRNGVIDDEADVSGADEVDGDETTSGSEEDSDDSEDEEDDSSMEDFINDGDISVDGDDEDLDQAANDRLKKKSKR